MNPFMKETQMFQVRCTFYVKEHKGGGTIKKCSKWLFCVVKKLMSDTEVTIVFSFSLVCNFD